MGVQQSKHDTVLANYLSVTSEKNNCVVENNKCKEKLQQAIKKDEECVQDLHKLRIKKSKDIDELTRDMDKTERLMRAFKKKLSKVILLNVVYTATGDKTENVVIKTQTDKYTKTYNLQKHKDQFQISNVIDHGGHSVEIKTTNEDGTKASFFKDELWFIKKVGEEIQIKLSALDKFKHPDTTCFWDNCYFIHIVDVGAKNKNTTGYDDNETITLEVKRGETDDNQRFVLTHKLRDKGHSPQTYLKDGTAVEWMNRDLETYLLKTTQANSYIVYMYNDKEKNALTTEERIREIDENTYDAVTIEKN